MNNSIIDKFIDRLESNHNNLIGSDSYGCLDKNFWHYKTIIDFPSATYQQPMLGLALLLSNNEINLSVKKYKRIERIFKSSLLYWVKIQNSDGSYNEYYENDCSFCPTSFTTYAASRSFYLKSDCFDFNEKKLIKNALLRSGVWLGNHSYNIVGNQMIMSLAALYYINKIFNNEKSYELFYNRKNLIKKLQSIEGWFSEYGGADIGYSLLSLDVLAVLSAEGDKDCAEMGIRLFKFLSRCILPDGTTGGILNSRNTSHVFYYGYYYFSQSSGIKCKKLIDLTSFIESYIDDKYFTYFYFNQIIEFILNNKKLRYEFDFKNINTYNKESGIYVIYHRESSVYLSSNLGGSFYIYRNEEKLYSDAGYLIQKNKNLYCNNKFLTSKIDVKKLRSGYVIVISTNFVSVKVNTPLVNHIVLFKIITKYILKIKILAVMFNILLKYLFVYKSKKSEYEFKRKIIIYKDKILIKDNLYIDLKFKMLMIGNIPVTMHSPSSFRERFHTNVLMPLPKIHRSKKNVEVIRQINLNENI